MAIDEFIKGCAGVAIATVEDEGTCRVYHGDYSVTYRIITYKSKLSNVKVLMRTKFILKKQPW